ncbi:MAG: glutamine--fructose-6-phosphate transaminase (isomerizing) [Defluviitaleaceae bacterium]|nr:glutamine--fructose-6-phosphate transaminase (isomerizing) [Defluviitaleaceae bacterium]
MCGVVGYIGNQNATDILLKGLKRLEYRGYDSSGIAVFDTSLQTAKCVGKILNLEKKLQNQDIQGNIGIGHTRWATHGAPSDINSHPHTSNNGIVTLVHNGIVENYLHLKKKLQEQGFEFISQTDTEVVANFLEQQYNKTKDPVDAIAQLHRVAVGSYALGVIFEGEASIYATKRQSPLVVGIGINENFIASDVAAVLEYTKNYYILEEEEIAIVGKNTIELLDGYKNPISKEMFVVNWDISAAEKGGYDHFMLKEIYEQPKALQDTISPRISDNKIDLGVDIDFSQIERLHVVACGSAFHAGLIGKNVIEALARIPTEVYLASEFRYQNPILDKNDLIIIISQSGETADTLAALRHGKSQGIPTLAIVNVLGSSIARECHYPLFTWAGPEIAVATTKAYSAQLAVLYLIGVKLAAKRNLLTSEKEKELIQEIADLPKKVSEILKDTSQIQQLAKEYAKHENAFLIGRSVDYAAVMEGSLKIKEISYIHSEAYAAGELKHGTISLIEENTLVIAVATASHVLEKTLSNLQEVKARGAKAIIIAAQGTKLETEDTIVFVPATNPLFYGTLTAIPLQLFAYYIAVERGCDVDMPRNLAKSVTVE